MQDVIIIMLTLKYPLNWLYITAVSIFMRQYKPVKKNRKHLRIAIPEKSAMNHCHKLQGKIMAKNSGITETYKYMGS